ncbi:MAG: hypothetical protein ACNFW9_06410 [Candidatus Kerfeldbacteria bacterium]|jgi:hypothetical protein
MTDNNKKLVIIIGGGLAVILVIYIIWSQFLNNSSDTPIVNTNTTPAVSTNLNVSTIDLSNTNNETEEIVLVENLTIARLANIFTERYGSYTSESEFKNTLELKVYMTDTLEKWVDNYLATQPDQTNSGEFFSIVTKVISNKIISQDDVSSKVELITQRVEKLGTEKDTYYQNITLELVYENETWLVNKVTWGDKQ